MPRPLPADGVPKTSLTTRWTKTKRDQLDAEAARAGVTPTVVLESAVDRFLSLSEATRDKLLSS